MKYLGAFTDVNKKLRILHTEDFIFMRDPVQPIWEDPYNANGGTCSMKIDFSKSYDSWLDLAVHLVSNNYNEMLEINGISITLKNNSTFIRKGMNDNNKYLTFLKIWNRDKTKKLTLPNSALEKIKSEFETKIYTPYSNKENFNKIKK
jgi:hypothetical protein